MKDDGWVDGWAALTAAVKVAQWAVKMVAVKGVL